MEITSNTELPSIREEIELRTSDGEVLVGELALPKDKPVKVTLITLHPLPTHGGFMDSHLLRKMANRLPELLSAAVLRFNTRGTTSPRGTSTGSFADGIGERFDVEAAVKFCSERNLPKPWLIGWSFGEEPGDTSWAIAFRTLLVAPSPTQRCFSPSNASSFAFGKTLNFSLA